MASKDLADMDFDEFVDNALGNESSLSTDTSDHTPKHKHKHKQKHKQKDKQSSTVEKHKAVLSNLAADDPEFYQYLLENDKQLLEFELSDEGTDSVSEEGAVEPVAESHSDNSDAESETPVATKQGDSDLSADEDKQIEIITKKQVPYIINVALRTH